MVKKLESIVYHVQRTFFIAVMTFMLLVLSLHVIMRFAFNNPIIWTDEIITMMQGTLLRGLAIVFIRSSIRNYPWSTTRSRVPCNGCLIWHLTASCCFVLVT